MDFIKRVRSRYALAGTGDHWTCFAFSGIPPSDLHCTHKYIGPLTEQAADQLAGILDGWFAVNPMVPFPVRFDQVDHFGPDRTIRVLRPSVEVPELSHGWAAGFLPGLRRRLDPFRADDYGYKPHVTSDEQVVDRMVTRYCWCRGDDIVREW